MKTVEVPVWLAVVVALGGPLITAAGVILGQYVNAWRESRREKVRWQRDKLAETARIALDHASQWRETRLAAYAEMTECISQFANVFTRLRDTLIPSESIVLARPLEKLTRQYLSASERVSLICADELMECMHANYTALAVPFSFGYPESLTEVPEKIRDHWKERTESAWSYYHEFRSISRKELGVTTPGLAEPDDS